MSKGNSNKDANIRQANDMKTERAKVKSELEKWRSCALEAEQNLANLRAGMEARPKLPQPAPLTLDPRSSALLILDLSNRCNDPAQVASKIAPGINTFLQKARDAKVLTIYTIISHEEGTPLGRPWDKFGRRPDEPVFAPATYDKFHGGEIQSHLEKRGIKTVIVTGASSNFAVLYTATTAAQVFQYDVVIPVDGIIAKTRYEDEYSLYQFTVLPGGTAKLFSFTTLEGITFRQ